LASALIATPTSPIPPERVSFTIRRNGTAVVIVFTLVKSKVCALDSTDNNRVQMATHTAVFLLVKFMFLLVIFKNSEVELLHACIRVNSKCIVFEDISIYKTTFYS
jgi:hypothetical protein